MTPEDETSFADRYLGQINANSTGVGNPLDIGRVYSSHPLGNSATDEPKLSVFPHVQNVAKTHTPLTQFEMLQLLQFHQTIFYHHAIPGSYYPLRHLLHHGIRHPITPATKVPLSTPNKPFYISPRDLLIVVSTHPGGFSAPASQFPIHPNMPVGHFFF